MSREENIRVFIIRLVPRKIVAEKNLTHKMKEGMRRVKCDSTKHANRARNIKYFAHASSNYLSVNYSYLTHSFHVFRQMTYHYHSMKKLPHNWLFSYIFIDICCRSFHLHDTHFLFIIALNEATKVISNFSLNAFYADIFLYFAAAVIFCFSSFF